jgi:hypothetical protein
MDHSQQPTLCKKCRAPIIFITTKRGKQMPCDAALFIAKDDDRAVQLVLSDGSVKHGVQVGDVGHISHFATCGFADEFRKEDFRR